jgi:ppGpp synthetase/RelA/SpoT-type nucleotidyltranferase
MRYAIPEYSKSRVDAAGRELLSRGIGNVDENSLAVINNWRAAHAQPLVTFNMRLRSRSAKFEATAFVAQRLKRLPSVEAKLRDRPTMRLSQMQDIGGVRAVVPRVAQVRSLVQQYRDDTATQHTLFGVDDYLATPKPDGYRGVHLIYRYHSDHSRNQVYNGLFIEVQIRSRMQHAWAMAVETVSLITGHALKSTLT